MAKHVMIMLVLVALTSAFYGCGDSTTAPTPTTEAPIIAPTNVFATVTQEGVSLSWDASSQSTLRGYNVYRIDDGAIARLNANTLTANSFLDRSAQWGSRYEYRVTSVSVKNAESAPVAVIVTNAITRDTRDQRPNGQ